MSERQDEDDHAADIARQEENSLLRLAMRVADGGPVDWEAESTGGTASPRLIRRLRMLASIAAVCGMPGERRGGPSAQVAGATPDVAALGVAAHAPEVGDNAARQGRLLGGSAEESAPLFLWGHLEVREKIGEGVYGEVYRAWETTLAREVALKLLRPEATEDSGAVTVHVLQEARNLARLRHPGVATVYGAEQIEGRVGIWMEYVRGHTLEDLLHQQGPFGAREAATIGSDLCRALAAVHKAGLVHRDVKTRNVMREEGGRIVLMDFGAGAELDPGEASTAQALAGTPVYLAPEILQGQPASPRSDIYALGVLLYRLVSGKYPVEFADLDALRHAHERGESRPLREIRPDLPEELVRIVETALSPQPNARFFTAGDLGQSLAVFLGTALEAVESPVADRIAGRARDSGRGTDAGGEAVPGARAASAARLRHPMALVIAVLALSAAAVALGLVTRREVARGVAHSSKRPAAPGVAPGGTSDAAANRVSIAIADCANETDEADLDGLSGMLITALEQSHWLSVMTRSRMSDVLRLLGKEQVERVDEEIGREIARRAGVDALLLLSVRKFGDLYSLDLKGLDIRRDEYLFTAKQEAHGRESIPGILDALAVRVRADLRERAGDIRAASLPIAQIATPNLDAYRHLYQAERHIDRLQMAQARAELEQAVSLDSTFGLAHSRLAYVDWWNSDFEREKRHIRRALALIDRVPEKERYLLRAQDALAESRGLEVARSILRDMERYYPDDKEMLYQIGDLSSHLSEFEMASRYLERVTGIDPGFVRALQHLARVNRDMGRRLDLRTAAERYVVAEPCGEAYELLGSALVALGELDEGVRLLERARELEPARLQSHGYSLSDAYLFQGEGEKALAQLTALLGLERDSGERMVAFRKRAQAFAHLGRFRQAFADLDSSVALARWRRQPVEETRSRIESALLRLVGLHDEAATRRELDACLSSQDSVTYEGTYFEYWPCWGGRLKLHMLLGDITEAERFAKVKLQGKTWYAPYVVAYLLIARGRPDEAAGASTHILQWGPATENIALLYALARSCFEKRQVDDTIRHLRSAESLHSNLSMGTPYYAASLLLMGRACEQRGESALARESYEKLLSLWSAADPDLPDLVEAKARIAALRLASVRR